MANKNGKEKQDSVLAQFKRDANSPFTHGAIKSAMADGKRNEIYRKQKELETKDKPRFVPSAPGFYGQD